MVEKVRLENNRRLELPREEISGRVSPKSPVSVNGGNGIRRKLVVIGDGACGKTSMLLAYTQGSFNQVQIIYDFIVLFVVLHSNSF